MRVNDNRPDRQAPRPDTSKNGLMKKRQLQVREEGIRERGRLVLNRLGKKDPRQ
jgi:hypothetical protein